MGERLFTQYKLLTHIACRIYLFLFNEHQGIIVARHRDMSG